MEYSTLNFWFLQKIKYSHQIFTVEIANLKNSHHFLFYVSHLSVDVNEVVVCKSVSPDNFPQQFQKKSILPSSLHLSITFLKSAEAEMKSNGRKCFLFCRKYLLGHDVMYLQVLIQVLHMG